MKLLLGAGAETDHMDADGESVLVAAAREGLMLVVLQLLAAGADPIPDIQ